MTPIPQAALLDLLRRVSDEHSSLAEELFSAVTREYAAIRQLNRGPLTADDCNMREVYFGPARKARRIISELTAAIAQIEQQAKCDWCNGRGEIGGPSGQTAETFSYVSEQCPHCKGTGVEQQEPQDSIPTWAWRQAAEQFVYEGSPAFSAPNAIGDWIESRARELSKDKPHD